MLHVLNVYRYAAPSECCKAWLQPAIDACMRARATASRRQTYRVARVYVEVASEKLQNFLQVAAASCSQERVGRVAVASLFTRKQFKVSFSALFNSLLTHSCSLLLNFRIILSRVSSLSFHQKFPFTRHWFTQSRNRTRLVPVHERHHCLIFSKFPQDKNRKNFLEIFRSFSNFPASFQEFLNDSMAKEHEQRNHLIRI